MSDTGRATPLWLWLVVTLPFGIAAGLAQYTMPYLLRDVGLSIERISEISALCLAPAIYQFLYAPIIDIGLPRKHWLLVFSALGAACLFTALLMPLPSRIDAFIALLVAGQAMTGLTGACSGALMATAVPNERRGRAGGWSNAGNLGGGALGAGVVMSLSGKISRPALGAITAALVFIPALFILLVDEPARPARSARRVFGDMFGSVWATLRSRAGITGILICASPVGTAAAMNLFSGVGGDYHVSGTVVTVVTGFAGGLITAAGALIGGYLCDVIPRRVAYLSAGALTAVCSYTMSCFPLAPQTYVVGVCTYLFIAGLCYAAFSALVLEIIGGQGSATAATQYTLFTAAANKAIAYTTVVLGIGATRWGGPVGMLRADALANVAGIAFLAIVMSLIVLGARRGQRTE